MDINLIFFGIKLKYFINKFLSKIQPHLKTYFCMKLLQLNFELDDTLPRLPLEQIQEQLLQQTLHLDFYIFGIR